MTAWHRSWQADIGLRSLGLALCGVAYVAVTHLIAVVPAATRGSTGLFGIGLAAIGFASGSAGTALATLGRHLFDEIEIGPGWRRR